MIHPLPTAGEERHPLSGDHPLPSSSSVIPSTLPWNIATCLPNTWSLIKSGSSYVGEGVGSLYNWIWLWVVHGGREAALVKVRVSREKLQKEFNVLKEEEADLCKQTKEKEEMIIQAVKRAKTSRYPGYIQDESDLAQLLSALHTKRFSTALKYEEINEVILPNETSLSKEERDHLEILSIVAASHSPADLERVRKRREKGARLIEKVKENHEKSKGFHKTTRSKLEGKDLTRDFSSLDDLIQFVDDSASQMSISATSSASSARKFFEDLDTDLLKEELRKEKEKTDRMSRMYPTPREGVSVPPEVLERRDEVFAQVEEEEQEEESALMYEEEQEEKIARGLERAMAIDTA